MPSFLSLVLLSDEEVRPILQKMIEEKKQCRTMKVAFGSQALFISILLKKHGLWNKSWKRTCGNSKTRRDYNKVWYKKHGKDQTLECKLRKKKNMENYLLRRFANKTIDNVPIKDHRLFKRALFLRAKREESAQFSL